MVINDDVNGTDVNRIQANLDKLDTLVREQKYALSDEEKSEMLELQALIHYVRGDEEEAKVFADEALHTKSGENYLKSNLAHKLAMNSKPVNTAKPKHPEIPHYFTVSTPRLIIFSILTIGFYPIYWAYKNWKAIQKSLNEGNQGKRIRVYPLVSSFFLGLTSFELFSRVKESAGEVGFDKKQIHHISYGISLLVLNAFALAFIPIAMFQKYMNATKEAAFGNNEQRQGTSYGEVIFVGIFALYWLFLVGAYMFAPDTVTTDTDSVQLSSEAQAKYDESTQLAAQYKICSDDLIAREKTLDEYSVVAVNNYNADLQKCETIRINQNAAVDEYNRLSGQ